jgi:hypothetical protein
MGNRRKRNFSAKASKRDTNAFSNKLLQHGNQDDDDGGGGDGGGGGGGGAKTMNPIFDHVDESIMPQICVGSECGCDVLSCRSFAHTKLTIIMQLRFYRAS